MLVSVNLSLCYGRRFQNMRLHDGIRKQSVARWHIQLLDVEGGVCGAGVLMVYTLWSLQKEPVLDDGVGLAVGLSGKP